jgi:citrate lyase subunit beta/citryl-CoA lyase/(S)-citramalyl-CoA lyase
LRYSRYCRSLLVTPATAVQRYRKAHEAGADICLVDLEDSVAPQDKEQARRQAAGYFSLPSARSTRCAVRINTVTEPDGLRDLLALREYEVKPDIVIVPKVETPRELEIVAQVLGLRPALELLAVLETPRGIGNAMAIATGSPALRALIFGSADYSFAIGARRSWEFMLPARAQLVNSARAAGIEAVDTAVFELDDLAALHWEAAQGKDLGFSGKVAVHPRQVAMINRAFTPDAGVLDQARRLVAAANATSHTVTVVDGVMAGRPFFDAAQRLLREFGAIDVAEKEEG